jgi:DNA modification methylase
MSSVIRDNTVPWPVSALKLNEWNPRTITTDAFKRLVESIKRDPEFMRLRPIVIDEDDMVLGGNMRLRACMELGMKALPTEWVMRATDLSPEQRQRFILVDNSPTGMAGDWDWDILANEWDAPELEMLGFDLDGLADLTDPVTGQTDPDAIPDPPGEAVSQRGEAFALGRHRLMCGSATEPTEMEQLLAGDAVDLLLTDPPYNVDYVGKTKDALRIENDAMDDDSYRSFLVAAFGTADPFMKPGAAFYIWHADTEGLNVRASVRDVGWRLRQCLIWNKNCFVLGRQDYHWKHEPCLYGWKDGGSHSWFGDRNLSTVLDFDRPSRNGEHPTMKPVDLFGHLIGNSAPVNGIVLDPFGGAGATLIAAERHERQARLMELDPHYCDVIRKRYAEFVHGSGCDWSELTKSPENVVEKAEKLDV